MTHEPECFEANTQRKWESPVICTCSVARAAYRSGRIDAANAVEAELHAQDELNLEFNIRILSAARGELE